MHNYSTIIEQSLSWFKELLRINTSNPPGNERPAIDLIARVLAEHKVTFQVLNSPSGRPNLVAEVPGRVRVAPLLLSSHVDVVPVENEADWTLPPFSAAERDGEIWGRGAVDVKYKCAFDLAALIVASQNKPRRTIRAAFVADEERGGEGGSKFLVTQHPQAIAAEYVLNEVGGFNVAIGAKNIVPIQLGEKSFAHLRIRAHGMATHASLPTTCDAIPLLGRAVWLLANKFPGFQLSKVSRIFFKEIARDQPAEFQAILSGLLRASRFRQALAMIPDTMLASQLRGMLCSTVTATLIQGGFKVNVIPQEAVADCDCRIIPDIAEDQFLLLVNEFLHAELGEQANSLSIERIVFCQGYEIAPSDGLFKRIKTCVETEWHEKLPALQVLPMLMPASSDSSNYIQAGIKPIGFAPLLFPKGFPGFALAHGVDERLPKASFEAGLLCYLKTLEEIAIR